MNPDLNKLHPYPFEKLATLKQGLTPPAELAPIALSIGEPKHAAPGFVIESMKGALDGLSRYPSTKGQLDLRIAIVEWLQRRFHLPAASLDPERHVLPVTGTREALFAFAQAVVERQQDACIIMPNPFYKIYEGAAFLAGAEPVYLNTMAEKDFVPDFDSVNTSTWQRCQLLYLCSPGNPTGAVIDTATLQHLIELAEQYDFIIASDECYSEIYFDEQHPPVGLLQAAAEAGHMDYRRCVVFHSLSKRSNLPGMRSGFVAGDADILARFLKYRTYHGCAMPPHHQVASIQAWQDESHVVVNRHQYRAKFDAVLEILQPVLKVERPAAGFYLWPQTPLDDATFTQQLYVQQNVSVLPGSYLSREVNGVNPGHARVRMALVAEFDECIEAAKRIRTYLESTN